MNGNFIFDIDGTLTVACDYRPEETEKEVKEKLGIEFFNKYCITAYNFPHYIFPGYFELFQWLHSLGAKFYFFSTGIEERNFEFVEKFMKKSFGDVATHIKYKVFSRQHCIDTTQLSYEEGEKYQSFFYGQKKKKIADIVVPKEEIANTLLIDDDYSYMVKGEEYNFIYVRDYGLSFAQEGKNGFFQLHKAFYLAGLFLRIFKVCDEKKISLVEAAKYVQIDETNQVLSRDFGYPTLTDINFYRKGKEILNTINPALDFYVEYSENGK